MMCQADGADAERIKLGLLIFRLARGSTAMKESFLPVFYLSSAVLD